MRSTADRVVIRSRWFDVGASYLSACVAGIPVGIWVSTLDQKNTWSIGHLGALIVAGAAVILWALAARRIFGRRLEVDRDGMRVVNMFSVVHWRWAEISSVEYRLVVQNRSRFYALVIAGEFVMPSRRALRRNCQSVIDAISIVTPVGYRGLRPVAPSGATAIAR